MKGVVDCKIGWALEYDRLGESVLGAGRELTMGHDTGCLVLMLILNAGPGSCPPPLRGI